jgi:hypothetical protein
MADAAASSSSSGATGSSGAAGSSSADQAAPSKPRPGMPARPRLPSWVGKMPRNAFDEGVCKRRVEWSYQHGASTAPPPAAPLPSRSSCPECVPACVATTAPHVIFLREAMKTLGCPRVYDNNQNTLCVSCPMALGGGYHPPSQQVRLSLLPPPCLPSSCAALCDFLHAPSTGARVARPIALTTVTLVHADPAMPEPHQGGRGDDEDPDARDDPRV